MPVLDPQLLFLSRVGGPRDQWLPQVRVKGLVIQAQAKEGFGVQVTVGEGDDFKARIAGNIGAVCKIPSGLPNGGKEGPYQWGYNQVEANLQQPFLKGPGWEWWGWTGQQARNAKAQYAPFISDSRIRTLTILDDTTFVAVGTADGGNTCLRTDPKNIDEVLSIAVGNSQTSGGGGGLSSWVFRGNAKGERLGQAVFRGSIYGVTSDAWGRAYLVGQGVIRGDDTSGFGFGDGAGLVILDPEWNQIVFKTHFGCEDGGKFILSAVSVDSTSGLMAVTGYCEGANLKGTAAVQEKAGGDADGILAVIRLWPTLAP